MAETADLTRERGGVLSTFAVLFGLLGLSNLLKPLHIGQDTGFVFFGHRLTGTPNAILGPLFGIYLFVYAAAIWQLRRRALPMGIAYACYVLVNLILFGIWGPKPPNGGIGYQIFGIVYFAIAVGVSWGAVYLLRQKTLT